MTRPGTLGDLRKSGYRSASVKNELRRNLIDRLRRNLPIFPGIIGFERTVIPQIQNAILARHDFILLGLRGQAKSRIIRSLPDLLDPEIPVIRGCQINDHPHEPVCRSCRSRAAEQGDALEIDWLPREVRYREKLATPDVTMADLIGDIDPIKAATEKRFYSDEEIIHFGIVPRTNRGIFAINELPDLSPRIQVGLLNILEERDLQIRGFPVRIPLDILLVFSANPEDYTNRGNIITPLKDRLDSQIMTHYPATLEAGMQITAQEAWVTRDAESRVEMPILFREIVEEAAVQARRSEFVDQASGVSARMPISAVEALVSNMERRGFTTGDERVWPRVCDLDALVPALSGKIELVYEGEQEGVLAVANKIVNSAVAQVFARHFPDAIRNPGIPGGAGARKPAGRPAPKPAPEAGSPYQPILDWFARGNTVDLSNDLKQSDYEAALDRVPSLRKLVLPRLAQGCDHEAPMWMEFLLEGLHRNSLVAKVNLDGAASYRDMLKEMFQQMAQTAEED